MSETMKKIIAIIIFLGSAIVHVDAKDGGKDISVSDLRFVRSGGRVEVSFTLGAGKKAAGRGRILVVTPVLENAGGRLELPPVVVEGRASEAALQRRAMAAGAQTAREAATMKSGGTVSYRTDFPYAEWMEGASLSLEGVEAGCCGGRMVEIGTVTRETMVSRGFDMVEVPLPAAPAETLTTAEKLAIDFPFILPVTAEAKAVENLSEAEIYEETHPGLVEMLTATRDNTLTVYFHQGESRIDFSYSGNNASLVRLISAVRAIEQSHDSRIVRVMVGGYASPEGGAAINEPLARDRALAVKSFLNDTSPVYGEMVTIYNGREDWPGLRRLVEESDMPHRREVLDIIDTVPVWDGAARTGRRGQLMNLRGGEPYRYMFREFFPRLRNAAYIRVYYENIAP